MRRPVLRPGGRAVIGMGLKADDPKEPGRTDASGKRVWSEADARRMMEEAGFADVSNLLRAPSLRA